LIVKRNKFVDINSIETVDDIYKIFEEMGVDEKTFNKWLNKLTLDCRRAESLITDLFFCALISKGFTKEHLRHLGIRVFPSKRCRARRLLIKIDYLQKYIVNDTYN